MTPIPISLLQATRWDFVSLRRSLCFWFFRCDRFHWLVFFEPSLRSFRAARRDGTAAHRPAGLRDYRRTRSCAVLRHPRAVLNHSPLSRKTAAPGASFAGDFGEEVGARQSFEAFPPLVEERRDGAHFPAIGSAVAVMLRIICGNERPF